MTIEMRAKRAGAAARAAAGEGMDLMTASTQAPQEFDRRQHQRRNRLIAVAAGAVLVVGAAIALPQLTDDPAPPASSGPEAETVTSAGVTVTLPEGWNKNEEYSNPDFAVISGPSEAYVTINTVTRVWDPETNAFAPVPADFDNWLRQNPLYRVTGEKPFMVAGQPSTLFTFTATARTANNQVPLLELVDPAFVPADAEYPGAQGPVMDYNTAESGSFAAITVDGELVVITGPLGPAQAVADYESILISATT